MRQHQIECMSCEMRWIFVCLTGNIQPVFFLSQRQLCLLHSITVMLNYDGTTTTSFPRLSLMAVFTNSMFNTLEQAHF